MIKPSGMMNILIPTDFTKKTKTALAYAFQLFGNLNVRYTLVNTYQEPQAASGMLISINDILLQDSQDGLKKELDWVKEAFPEQANNCTTLSFYGPFRNSIKILVSNLDVDLVVMCTEPKEGWHQKFLNNHRGLISNHEFPVLIIPEDQKFDDAMHVAIATDLKAISTSEKDQYKFLKSIITSNCSAFSIATVVKDNTVITDKEKLVSEEMVRIFTSLSPTFFQLKNNSITKAINLFSLDNKVSMLVMTARRHNLLYDIMNQSNTKEMALFSHIPLMVLPEV